MKIMEHLLENLHTYILAKKKYTFCMILLTLLSNTKCKYIAFLCNFVCLFCFSFPQFFTERRSRVNLVSSRRNRVVTKSLQRHGCHCQNVVAQSKIRVVSTSISEFEITWLQDVIKILLQHCSNIVVTISVGFLGYFSMDYSVLFAVVET